jgi:Fe-S-cluster containining protein
MTRAHGYEPGRLEQRLEELWQQKRFALYSPRNVWSWLELRGRFELRFVRASSLKVMVPRGLVPDCESCLELCCTGPNAVVSLRLSDIAALVDAGKERFITHERPAPPPGTTWARLESEWSVFTRVFPVLQRDKNGTCALLTEERQCGAYPSWPLSCARYPYALDVLNGRVFLAKGCGSHRQVTLDDVPGAVRRLVDNAARAYNERVRDVILLHVAFDELHELGLLEHLRLEGKLSRRASRLQAQ